MSKNDNSKMNIVSDILDSEQAKSLTVPMSKSIGTALGDICDLAFGKIHEKAEMSRLKHEKNIEDFKNKLNEDLKNIPEENLIPPKKSIVGPALEASKYYFDESEIRDMFERLIVNSMDSRMSSKVHPSFTEIIKQISPLDAQNLVLFQGNDQLPIIKFKDTGEKGRYTIISTNIFMSNPNCQDMDLQSVSISSLSRVGLIKISYNEYLSNEEIYKLFLKSEYYANIKSNFDKINQFRVGEDKHKLEYVKGLAQITPLGKTFINVCLSPLPNKSTP